MKRAMRFLSVVLTVCMMVSLPVRGQVQLHGDISGLVTDEKGDALPGVAVTLTGEKLFQKSLATVTSDKGGFRFLHLNPGNYELAFSLPGFSPLQIASVTVSVGRDTPIRVRLTEAKIQQEVVVKAEAPLIETKTVQLSTNFSQQIIAQIPTTRNMQDLVEATPAVNDHGAYGAGARVKTNYYEGSAANAYLLNGVDISDQGTGVTWVNPNYDSIEEIQVVGSGASAEYGNFTGAVLNVITKDGGNAFHGGLSSYFTSKTFTGDNSGGVLDLTPREVKYDTETSGTFGGPVIREKLFFFLAGGYSATKSRNYAEIGFGSMKQAHGQAKMTWLPNAKNTLTAMVNLDPLNHDNLGLQANCGPEIAYSREYRSTVWNASWRSILSASTMFEVKYAGFTGRDLTDPVSPTTAAISDYSTYMFYGSSGYIQDNTRTRHQIDAVLTHYADDLFNTSHEFKAGFEYESSDSRNDFTATGPDASMFEIYPYLDYYWILGYKNYYQNTKAHVNRPSGFLQDTVSIGRRLTLNLGVRLDAPRLTSAGIAGTIASFTNIAPRLGLSYDFTGDAKNVLHIGYGRYYDKMTTDGFSLALPGMGEIELYSLLTTTAFDPTEENIANLPSQVLVPENLYYTLPSSSTISVDPDLKGPYSDVFNARFEKELFRDFSLSVEYIHKEDRGLIRLETTTEHTYEAVEWTDPYLDHTITVWAQTDSLEDNWYYTNSNWAKRRHNILILTLRKRPSARWSVMSSLVYQDSKGNDDNTTGAIGTAYGQDTNPNYTENPLMWGTLTYSRPFQFKLLGTYQLPWGIDVSGDLHVLSGMAWAPTIDYSLTGLYGGQISKLLLEQRGSRHMPWTWYFNFRADKTIMVGGASKLELIVDLFNVFNRANAVSVGTEPYGVFPISGESSFGKVFKLSTPFSARFGLRWSF